MDLNTVTAIVRPRQRSEITPWRPGDAWLAGGTVLFSEPQPHLTRLIDLGALAWPSLALAPAGLEIAATCTLADLEEAALPPEVAAAPLFAQCCRALYGSFKVRAAATVGGNLCAALPAGPMIALTAALDGRCTLWQPAGGIRHVNAVDFVRGAGETVLAPGELLRAVTLPWEALRRRTAFRRIALNTLGRSAALAIGTRGEGGAFALTVTAATAHPVRLAFPVLPEAGELEAKLAEAIPADGVLDDVHGARDWRHAMVRLFAREIRAELAQAWAA